MNKAVAHVAGVVLVALVAVAARGQTWDLAADFSLGSNPNGGWSYGNVGFTLATIPTTSATFDWWTDPGNVPTVGLNVGTTPSYGIAPGHCSLECDFTSPDARWTAPAAGLYDITLVIGGTTGNEGGGWGNGHVDQANLAIDGANQPYDSFVNNVKTWSLTDVGLNAGDTVDATINEAYGGGNTDTMFTIAAVPEPGAFALVGLAALALRRRRH